jgi:hypothetical protein
MNGTGLTADIVGRAVFDASGEGIGQLVNLYADTETGAVSFAGVAMIRRTPPPRVRVPDRRQHRTGVGDRETRQGTRAPRAVGPTRRDATRRRRTGTVCSLRHSVPVPADEQTPTHAMPLTDARTCTALKDAA